MVDANFAPLTTSCVRSLNDKLYEKRKVAALEIEKMVKEYNTSGNTSQIQKVLKVLGEDFSLGHNPNQRKGGLIGLAAVAIALGKDSSNYVNELVKPVLPSFYDCDSRVRYYACESLYNIVKVTRGSIIPFFNDIFDGLSKLAADPDHNVRNGSELLNKLMKDIVIESSAFDLVAFLPLLRERVYVKNEFCRQFIVSWVVALDSVPDIDMLVFLPEILDGLFQILGDKHPEVRKMCEIALSGFLRSISQSPSRCDFSAMINILIVHSQSSDDVIKHAALQWMSEFVSLSGTCFLPFASGVLTAVLPCLSYCQSDRRDILELSGVVNKNLMKLIDEVDDVIASDADQEVTEEPKKCLNLSSVIDVLSRELSHEHMQTRIAALRWLHHLFLKIPHRMMQQATELFPTLVSLLSDPSDEVVLLGLQVVTEISLCQATPPTITNDHAQNELTSFPNMNGYIVKFLVALMQLFSTNKDLLDERGAFIIRQLCLLLKAEDIYRCCSVILLHEADTRFAAVMIESLNLILLTSTELFELRSCLKELDTDESCSLFCCMYKAWSHNPVSTIALCFLTQNYSHALSLIQLFENLEVTLELLVEVDKLIQLIESPIFTFLRMQLLEPQRHPSLLKSLYGLLMLLPQSEAFNSLRCRLQCVPNLQLLTLEERKIKPDVEKRPSVLKHIDFKLLQEHFLSVQHQHKLFHRKPKTFSL